MASAVLSFHCAEVEREGHLLSASLWLFMHGTRHFPLAEILVISQILVIEGVFLLKDSLLGSVSSFLEIKLIEMSLMMVSLCTVGDYFFELRRNTRWAFRGMGAFNGLLCSVLPYYLSSCFLKINSKTTFQRIHSAS